MGLPRQEPTDFRVPKRRTSVDVLQTGGAWQRFAMFLSSSTGAHGGPERISDLLEARHFFPVVDEPTGKVTMLARSGIGVVRVEPWAEASAAELAGDAIEHRVEVQLACGVSLQGVLCFTAPPEQARLIDYLNRPSHFFVLQESETVALINKENVARVELR